MAVDRWERIQELFEKSSSLSAAQRRTFLAETCPEDPDIRNDVLSLLEHEEQAPPGFLCPPAAVDHGRDIADPKQPDPLLGKQIRRYTIMRVIAQGGMGTVYEARQENPSRPVALKVMRAGITSHYALRHFEYESQILARLHHPHIAQVYEAGTFPNPTAGAVALPFFAMEYIPDARPLTQYATENDLNNRQRLELFTQVCEAVHYGHQKGVIHRDLKPANLLVDQAGRVKIIDFGVARSTDSDVAVTTLKTDVGQLVGTLQYMSPEQCAADPLELDVRSDVYSLGVVLYELLCGRLPYEVSHSSIQGAARMICEQDAIRPSEVDRRLRGDLEAIVLTALEKDREKRYQSGAELAADLQHYLHHEPIAARSPGVFTRLCHVVTRHPILMTLMMCLAVVAGSLAMTAVLVRYYYTEPYAMKLSEDRRTARLVSRDGHVLRELSIQTPKGISTAKFVARPTSLGGGHVALIGFGAQQSNPFPGALCAFDPNKDFQHPIWSRAVTEDQMPVHLITDRHFTAKDSSLNRYMVADVFPERPGSEIVAIYNIHPTTQSALRVYDLAGTLLYQTWVDLSVSDLYWMSGPRLLVLLGLNGRAYWEQRGHPEVNRAHPFVVFALRLQECLITKNYLRETPGIGPLDPVWYRCLLPPKTVDRVAWIRFVAPAARYDSSRFAELVFRFQAVRSASFTWVLDANGHEVPHIRILNDYYKRNLDKLPDPDLIHLGPLPPIVDAATRIP